MKILIIGGGNMGFTYAKSIAENSPTSQVSILEKDSNKITELKSHSKFAVFSSSKDCVSDVEIILLAVKPQVIGLVFDEIKPFVNKNQVIISIMAGVTQQSIANGLEIKKVVRAMPNLPSQIQKGVTGYICASEISENEKKIIRNILAATGTVVEVENEDQIDAITALSGSGPAYVFYFMNAMIEQAKTYGFSPEAAKQVVVDTFTGAASLFGNSDLKAEEWIERVTSKGGTTHAALTNFKSNTISDHIKEGVEAAYLRAKELAKG